ncbi:MAG: hypothetical protein HQL74_06030 [Magnetococcales bacterium]|nr:hypothetical protein [Magnetococcales bacterium]
MINKLIGDPSFIARHRTATEDFTRERILTLKRLVTLLLNQFKCSLQNKLDHFFQVIGVAEFGERFVTNAALSKARKKLKAFAFVELNNKSLDAFHKENSIQKKWHGFRLLAIDGSKVELPNE